MFTVTTSAMIDTISVPKRNKSLYVTIGTALLSGGKAPSVWRANRLPVMVALKDALLHQVNFSIGRKYCQINTNCHNIQRFEEIFSNLFYFTGGEKCRKNPLILYKGKSTHRTLTNMHLHYSSTLHNDSVSGAFAKNLFIDY